MPVIFQEQISRTDLHCHPGNLYVFGDNEARRGMGTTRCVPRRAERNWRRNETRPFDG